MINPGDMNLHINTDYIVIFFELETFSCNCLVTFLLIGRILKIAKSYYELRHVRLSAWNNSTPTGRISIKLDI
jgi:hypothetical protein